MEAPPPTSDPRNPLQGLSRPAGLSRLAGLSRPAALLITCLTVLLAIYIQNPSFAILHKYKYGHRLPLQFTATQALPQTASESVLTKHVLAHLTSAQLSSRERTLEDIANSPATRARLLATLSSLYLYRSRALGAMMRKRKAFAKMVRQDRLLLQQARVDYSVKLAGAEKRVRHTAKVMEQILAHSCAYYAVARKEVEAFARATEPGSGGAGDHTRLIQAMKHFVRDYSTEGTAERQRTFGLIQGWLAQELPESGREAMKILVPGCGVGGLLWVVAAMGFEVVGVEWSFWMNIMQHFIASAGPVPIHTIYPYIDWWSHHITNSNMTRPIHFPYSSAPLPPAISLSSSSDIPQLLVDTHPAHRVFLHESDFTTIHPPFSPPQYTCIITLFFLDTAQSLPTYLRKIHDYLLPGGVWINLGPLLYGTKPWVELSLEEVVAVAEGMGFVFGSGDYNGWVDTLGDGKVVGLRAGYNVDWKGIGRNEYLAQAWVARKKG
ncbi:N2227-like protein-domain-containing protein [Tirmania nivea]|nr:N2227-like protein-domain-containing protein [Tirmania nivea]